MKRSMLVLLPVLLAAGPASPDPAKVLAGRYYLQFPDHAMDVDKGHWREERYTGQRIVEIVPVAPGAAYFRAYLDFEYGYSCDISGVAKAEGDVLVFRDPDPSMNWPPDSPKQCVLTIRRAGKSLRLDDGEESCHAYCGGAYATLSGIGSIPYASKRPIRYLDRLKRSEEYRNAITEWRTGKSPK